MCFVLNHTATTEIYTLSLHDALPISLPRRSTESSPAGERTTRTSSRLARVVRQATQVRCGGWGAPPPIPRRPPFAWRSEEHTSELQSLRHLVCRLLLEKKKK